MASERMWQTCPVCRGTGVVGHPPFVVPGQAGFTTTSAGPWPCNVCGGRCIIDTPDLSPEEREALADVCTDWWMQAVDMAEVADFVQRALAAVPRLREVEGMGLVEAYGWCVRFPDGTTESRNDESAARAFAEHLNKYAGPGHHAVRLAVVEVATPTPEAHDGDE